MSSEKYEQMMKQFPHLYADRHAPMTQTCMCWGIDCGAGWYDLLYELSAKLEAAILKLPPDGQDHVRAVQVKEKWGSLHFYMTCESDEISTLIREACKKSSKICEECGKPGKNEEIGGWYRTRCEECYRKELVSHFRSRLELLLYEGIAISQEEWNRLK